MKKFLWIIALLSVGLGAFAAPKPKAKKEKPIKHYLDIYAGGGVGTLGYQLQGGAVDLSAAFGAGLGYTYFFHPSVGLQLGLSFSRVVSSARLTERMEWRTWQDGSPLTDYTGEPYIHYAAFSDFRERQQAYLVEVPLGLRFRYFKSSSSKAGLHAALGAKLAIPVMANYTRVSGDITHTGWYEQWQLTLHDLPGRFETERFDTKQEESITNRLHLINAEAYAELGLAVRINSHYELYIAAYGQYLINDFSATQMSDRVPLGFRNTHNNYAFMNEYHGLIGTDKVGALHPWMAGLKIGISIWPGKTEKEKKKELKKLLKEFPDEEKMVTVHDTVYIHDTVCPNELRPVVPVAKALETKAPQKIDNTPLPHERQLDSLLAEAVIWFHFDDDVPILEPAYVLDSVVAMMKRYPDLKIHVYGHACRLGTDSYNQRLALKRARAVAAVLIDKGVEPERMLVWSFGEEQPYRYNTEKQLSKDRRVEIIPARFATQ